MKSGHSLPCTPTSRLLYMVYVLKKLTNKMSNGSYLSLVSLAAMMPIFMACTNHVSKSVRL